MKNDCGEFPLRIYETTVLIFPCLPFFSARDLQPSSSFQSFPGIEASYVHSGQIWSVQGLGYCSQLMKKQQIQSHLVCQFSQKDPHPAKIILKFTLVSGAPEKMERLKKRKTQYEVWIKEIISSLEECLTRIGRKIDFKKIVEYFFSWIHSHNSLILRELSFHSHAMPAFSHTNFLLLVLFIVGFIKGKKICFSSYCVVAR